MQNEDTARRYMGPNYEGSFVQRRHDFMKSQQAVKDRQARIMRGETNNKTVFGKRTK